MKASCWAGSSSASLTVAVTVAFKVSFAQLVSLTLWLEVMSSPLRQNPTAASSCFIWRRTTHSNDNSNFDLDLDFDLDFWFSIFSWMECSNPCGDFITPPYKTARSSHLRIPCHSLVTLLIHLHPCASWLPPIVFKFTRNTSRSTILLILHKFVFYIPHYFPHCWYGVSITISHSESSSRQRNFARNPWW